jgi:HEAT repeat protein
MRQIMEYIGISETAEAMSMTVAGSAPDVQPSALFDRLQGFLDDDSYRVRLQAIISITRVTRTGRLPRVLVVPELIQKLSDEEEIVRVVAADALAQLNAVLAIPAIYRALGTLQDEARRNLMRRSLERLLGHAAR